MLDVILPGIQNIYGGDTPQELFTIHKDMADNRFDKFYTDPYTNETRLTMMRADNVKWHEHTYRMVIWNTGNDMMTFKHDGKCCGVDL